MSKVDKVSRALVMRAGNQDAVEVAADSTLEPQDNLFWIVDGTDKTKRVGFSVGGLTTGTDRTVTFPDADINVGTGVGGKKSIVDTGGAFATPIVLTAADSGKVYLLDDAAGLDFSLPALGSTTAGIYYGFRVTVTNTSNSYRLTAQTGDIINGHVLTSDFDAAYTAPQILAAEGGGSTLAMTLTAIAQGGGINGWFEIEALSANMWFVRGNLIGDGTITTPFS